MAYEVSVKSPVRYEVENIRKCLAGGFPEVAVIRANQRKLEQIRDLFAEKVSAEELAKLTFQTPDDFIAKLYQRADDDPAGADEERRKPRKRKISLISNQLTAEERQAQESRWLSEIRENMKRFASK